LIKSLNDLGNETIFRGANCVFVAPDEKLAEIRTIFHKNGITNDVFGVRDAKGLEFSSVAVRALILSGGHTAM